MNTKGEKQQEEFRLRHEAEFRHSNDISQTEWDLAEAMATDLQNGLFTRFWEMYDRDHEIN